MSQPDHRGVALRFLLATVAWVACLFCWIAILSFSPADWPSQSTWPLNSPPANLCGVVGAWIAHTLFYHLGWGAFGLAGLGTVLILAWSQQVKLTDAWLRVIGGAMVCTVASTLAAMYLSPGERDLVSGPGGTLGSVVSLAVVTRLQMTGGTVALLCGLLVGMLLAADHVVIAAMRWLGLASRKSAPVILRGGGRVIAGAGAAVAAGMAQMSTRLATAGADLAAGRGAAEEIEVPRPARRRPRPAAAVVDDEEGDAAAEVEKSARRSSAEPKAGNRETDGERAIVAGEEDAAETTTAPREKKRSALAAIKNLVTGKDVDEPLPDVSDTKSAAKADLARTATPIAASGPIANATDERRAEETLPAVAPKAVEESRPSLPKVTDLSARADKPQQKHMALEFPTKIGNYELPALSLLEDAEPIDKDAVEILCREKAFILQQTLTEFRLEVEVVSIETGPVITVFELKLAPGIKVSQIASLTNDMARALKAPAVRVVAPLPGKNTIGIEVPNIDKEKVRLKDLICATGSRGDQHMIPLYLGKDASGAPLVSDLTKMPHLLVAGTTGSGKSVCAASIILSILMTRTPEEVQLILVDPKVVELAMFKDIPHLMCPIVTEMSKAEGILDWAATKMDERYALLAEAGVKDIRSYNKLGKELLKERMQIETDEEMTQIPLKLPYLVIVIDELADLMMTSAKEVEFYLCRIAQKSRAVGIHLIVSTQRPQANVVTGLIKSNLPSRIAFRVASRLDSRIVLDQNGGEVLMGQGDMLFLPPGSSKLVRAQGSYIGDDELRAVVKHCRTQGEPNYHPELIRMPKSGEDAGERDELFDSAVDVIIESRRGSVSLLQRRLTIGYSRASRLVEQMYAAGIVGEYKGSQAREVLLTKDEWQAVKQQRDTEVADEILREAGEG